MRDAGYYGFDNDLRGVGSPTDQGCLLTNRETNRVIGISSSIGLHRSVCGARNLAEDLVKLGYRVTVINLECARHP